MEMEPTTPLKMDRRKDPDAQNDCSTPDTVATAVESNNTSTPSLDEDLGKCSVHQEHDASIEVSLCGEIQEDCSKEKRQLPTDGNDLVENRSPSSVSLAFYSPNRDGKSMSDVTSPGCDGTKGSDEDAPTISSSDAKDQVLAVSFSEETVEWEGTTTWDAAVADATTKSNVIVPAHDTPGLEPPSSDDKATFYSVLSKLDSASSWFEDMGKNPASDERTEEGNEYKTTAASVATSKPSKKSAAASLHLVPSDTEECTIDADPTHSDELSGIDLTQMYTPTGSDGTPEEAQTKEETLSLKTRESLSFEEARAFFERKDIAIKTHLGKCIGVKNVSRVAPRVSLQKQGNVVKENFDEVLFELVMKACDEFQYPRIQPSLEMKKSFDAVIQELRAVQKDSKRANKKISLFCEKNAVKGAFERKLNEVQCVFGGLQDKRRWKKDFDTVLKELNTDIATRSAQHQNTAPVVKMCCFLVALVGVSLGLMKAYSSYSAGFTESEEDADGYYTPEWLLVESA